MTELELWVIYKNPLDYPNKFVARKWLNNNPTKTMYIEDTLDDIRKKIPQNLFNLHRMPNDDPKIVEVWI